MPYRSLDQQRIRDDLDQARLVAGKGSFERDVELFRFLDANPKRTAVLGVLGEARVGERGLPHMPVRSALLLRDLAKFAIVEHDVGDVHIVLHRGVDLCEVLAESAVTGHRDDLAPAEARVVRLCRGPRPDRCRQGKANRAQVAGHQHRMLFALEVAAE